MRLKTLSAFSREAKERETTLVPRGLKDRAWELGDANTWPEWKALFLVRFSGYWGPGRTREHNHLLEWEETRPAPGHPASAQMQRDPCLEVTAVPSDLPFRVATFRTAGSSCPHCLAHWVLQETAALIPVFSPRTRMGFRYESALDPTAGDHLSLLQSSFENGRE